MNQQLKKNILDLQYQKYLVIASTTVILFFTYMISLWISLITGQVKFENLLSVILTFAVSVGVIGLCSIFFLISRRELAKVVEKISVLEQGHNP